MAATIPSTARTLFESLRPITSRSTCRCPRLEAAREQIRRQQQRRGVSTASSGLYQEMEVDPPAPRWAQTPPGMQSNVRLRPLKNVGGRHDVNKDPKRLDNMYVRFLGPDGSKLLSEETRWLAVTHKSFDHGRRGFNDRLAFLGKRIVELQTSLNMIANSPGAEENRIDTRTPFSHPAVDGIEFLTQEARNSFTHHSRVAKVARQYGMAEVARWVPKDPSNLMGSGAELVWAQAMYAIIGALALEQGSVVANRICRDRLLAPLGLAKQVVGEIDGARS